MAEVRRAMRHSIPVCEDTVRRCRGCLRMVVGCKIEKKGMMVKWLPTSRCVRVVGSSKLRPHGRNLVVGTGRCVRVVGASTRRRKTLGQETFDLFPRRSKTHSARMRSLFPCHSRTLRTGLQPVPSSQS